MNALNIEDLDKDLHYICVKCKHQHSDIPGYGTCRAGRNMHSDGCDGKLFTQGVHWFRDATSSWDRGCWHWVEVPKGADSETALKEHIAAFRG